MTPNRDDSAPSCPTLLIAAGASGQGKTSVTAALARLHARQGRRVRVFKCGPDFLDPHWLALASGAPVHQIDLWMTGEADARAFFAYPGEEGDGGARTNGEHDARDGGYAIGDYLVGLVAQIFEYQAL